MEFKFDLAPEAPLLATVPGHGVTLGNTEIAYEVARDGAVHVMSSEVHQALLACGAFRTLDQHYNSVLAALPALAGRADALRAVLDQLVRTGLLVEQGAWFAGLARETAAAPTPFRAVYVRAVDASRLAMTFASIADYEATHHAARRYVVIDDGAGAEAIASVVAAASSAAGATLDVAIIDRTARERIAKQIAPTDGELASAARGALGLDAAPALGDHAFNVAALLGAGARFAWLDDGDLLDARRHGPERAGLALERPGAFTLDLAPDRITAISAGESSAIDPIEAALASCGLSAGTVLARGGGLVRAGVEQYEIGRLPLAANAPVVAVELGHRGAPRRPGALFLYRLRGGGRDALWRDASVYRAQLERPAIVHGAVQPTLMRASGPVPFVLDGTQPLPPLCDGAETAGLFGALLRATHPRALTLQVPLTLGRYDERAAEDVHRTYTPGRAAYLAHEARRVGDALRSDDVSARYANLAAALRDLASASATTRSESLAHFVADERSAHLLTLQEAIAHAEGGPAYWHQGLREAVLTHGRVLMSYTPPRLAEWPEGTSESDSAERHAQLLHAAAQRYAAWPALHAAAAAVGDALTRE